MKQAPQVRRGNTIGDIGTGLVGVGVVLLVIGRFTWSGPGHNSNTTTLLMVAGIAAAGVGAVMMLTAAKLTWKGSKATSAMNLAKRADKDAELGIITATQALERKEKAAHLAVAEGMADREAQVWDALVPNEYKSEVPPGHGEHFHRVLADRLTASELADDDDDLQDDHQFLETRAHPTAAGKTTEPPVPEFGTAPTTNPTRRRGGFLSGLGDGTGPHANS
ncbi:hypothetical protein [Mycobacteroides abscessus]|uniref:hypothetical protein n=1 Tax=Mycobacteroides abscessus TaxID=36809 RepID=UPI00092B31C1|nr:hypothetical protein [Mycobacteroides abscessus]SHP22536.1 Uncharacterised protein [Mycobacteroides abscessus subsp. abscessus]